MKNIKEKVLKIKYIIPILILLILISLFNYIVIVPVNSSVTEKVIVLDAGHGGEDEG